MKINLNKIKIGMMVGIAFLLPGSAYIFLGRAVRGLFMTLWIFVFGYITFKMTTDEIPFIVRISGGLLVWLLSIIEIHRIAMKKWIG